MDYKKIYDNLVKSRLPRGTTKRRNDGFNRHHIIPKCIGGEDKDDNYVLLTFKEHIIAHKLLCEIYKDNYSLKYAFLRMIQSSHSDRKENIYKEKDGKIIHYSLSAKEADELRNLSIEFLRKINTGKKLTSDHKEKLRISHLGKSASEKTKQLLSSIRLGHIVTQETRDKISKSRKGIKFSEEHKKNIGLSKKGRILSEEVKLKISGKNSIKSKPVIDSIGNEFCSIKDCCEFYKISVKALKSWIKNKPEKGFKFKETTEMDYSVIDTNTNKTYKSLTECAKDLNISRATVTRIVNSSNGYIKFINK